MQFCILLALPVVFIASVPHGTIPSSAALIPVGSVSDIHAPDLPHIRDVSTAHHALFKPWDVARVVEGIRLAFQAEKSYAHKSNRAVLLPHHVRLEGYTGLGAMQGGRTEYLRKRMDRISLFGPSVKVSALEEKNGPERMDESEQNLATGYLPKSQHGREQWGTAAIRRAKIESLDAKTIMNADRKTGQRKAQIGVGSDASSNEPPRLRPSAKNGVLYPAASQPRPLPARADSGNRPPVKIQTASATMTKPSAAPSSSGPESSNSKEEAPKGKRGVFQSAVGSIGSLYSSFIGKISGAKTGKGNTRRPPQASDEEVRAVVNEIIAQVMIRTAGETIVNKQFPEHESMIDGRGRIAVRPVMELVQRIVPRVLESAGWSVKIQKAIRKQTRDRLLRLKSQGNM